MTEPQLTGFICAHTTPGYPAPCGFGVTYTYLLKNTLNGSQGTTRGGMFAKNKLRQEHNIIGGMMADTLQEKLKSNAFPLGFHLKFIRVGKKRLDDDNLAGSFKSIRDGFADEFKFDDGSGVCKFEYQQETGKQPLIKCELYCTSCWLFSEYGLKIPSLQVHGKKPIYSGPHW